eukprot:11204674-Lingulodinium_polyedra.AAC.1
MPQHGMWRWQLRSCSGAPGRCSMIMTSSDISVCGAKFSQSAGPRGGNSTMAPGARAAILT